MNIQENTFYFLKEEYFKTFPDNNLMRNHEKINNELHNRPCFYALKDRTNKEILWMIPISSKVEKYKSLYSAKISKYGSCDTIVFGEVLGQERAFLIQNICPVTSKYLSEQYMKDDKAVKISGITEKILRRKTEKILRLSSKNNKVVFPDIKKIKQELIRQLEQDRKVVQNRPHKQKIVMKFPNRDNNNRGMGR